jgi:hypothetical protein
MAMPNLTLSSSVYRKNRNPKLLSAVVLCAQSVTELIDEGLPARQEFQELEEL